MDYSKTQQDSEKLRAQAEQQGRELGQNDIAQQADRLATSSPMNASLKPAKRFMFCNRIRTSNPSMARQWQHETVPLAVSIAERLVHRQIEIDPSIILDWLNESIRLVQTDHRLTFE